MRLALNSNTPREFEWNLAFEWSWDVLKVSNRVAQRSFEWRARVWGIPMGGRSGQETGRQPRRFKNRKVGRTGTRKPTAAPSPSKGRPPGLLGTLCVAPPGLSGLIATSPRASALGYGMPSLRDWGDPPGITAGYSSGTEWLLSPRIYWLLSLRIRCRLNW